MSKRSNNIFAFTLLLVTAMYGLFQARILIKGPMLFVSLPENGSTVSDVLLEVEGKTEHVTHVSINGRPILLDTSGEFRETLVTPSGYGVIFVEARNRFGHHTEKRIEFYGAPNNTNS